MKTLHRVLGIVTILSLGCLSGEQEPTSQAVQADWRTFFGYNTISSTYEPPRYPSWVMSEGVMIRFPGTLCGTIPAGVLCVNEVNVPATTCRTINPVDPGAFLASANASRPFFNTAVIYVQPSTMGVLNQVLTIELIGDPGNGVFPVDHRYQLEIARRGIGLTFRYHETTESSFGSRQTRTTPQITASGTTCTNGIFGASPEAFLDSLGHRSDFSAPQIYQPNSGLRVSRDAGPLCGTFFGGVYACTRFIHLMSIVNGECWFTINRDDSLGAHITEESSENVTEARRLRSNATCLSP